MKKLLFVFILVLLIGSTCLANNGDKVGYIYSTDIKAYINGIPVKSYNIGGKTCVAIEDVTIGAYYNDNYRILVVYSLAPEHLVEGFEKSSTKSGKIVGSIYSTDIKTYFYDNVIPSYNIGGKTCVAIEDIGNNNYFSAIGGKFIWNPIERTIKLEYMYDNFQDLSTLLHQYYYGLKIKNGLVSFVPDSSTSGWISTDMSDSSEYLDKSEYTILPLYYQGNQELIVIGYEYYGKNLEFNFETDADTPTLDKVDYTFNYFYIDSLKEILNELGIAKFNRDEVINQHINSWMAQVIQEYETEDYTFLYLWQPTSHGRNEMLLYVRNDGSFEYVHQKLPGGNYGPKTFSDFSIDKVRETATFKVTGSEEQTFTFNMKTSELTTHIVENSINQQKADTDTRVWLIN